MHINCPHCHNGVEVIEEASLADIDCSSCGSHFSLVGDDPNRTLPGDRAAKTIGRFELVNEVGKGAFGSVWRGKDPQLDRTVAIKIPRKGQLNQAEREQFFREARAAAQLKHPNIVPVHEIGKDGETIYIVSDFVQGVSLEGWLSAKPLGMRESAKLCIKVCRALDHAHEKGVVHRDLKPGNIMLDAQGEPHVMDFGLAKRDAGEITMTVDGQILGTPAYMSPEQARGSAHDADGRSDLYSVGVILFQLLTGELPFRGNMQMLIHQVINDEPPSPLKLNSNIDKDLATITTKCLEKVSERRYQNAIDLADDLQRYLDGKPIAARPVSKVERAWRWCKRKPALSGALTLSSLLLLTLAIGGPIVASHQTMLTEKANEATDKALDEKDRARKAESAAIAAREKTDEALANARYVVANLRMNDGRVADALDLLDSIPKQYRNAEWQLSRRELSGSDMTLYGHEDAVQCVAYSRDGRLIASASRDKTVRLWDAVTGVELQRLDGHTDVVNCVAFSPDGSLLGSTGNAGELLIWSVATGMVLKRQSCEPRLHATVCFSPSGKRIAWGSLNSTIAIWNHEEKDSLPVYASGQPLIENGKAPFGHIVFSRDGNKVYASDVRRVCSFSSETAEYLETLIQEDSRPGFGYAMPFSINPNDKLFAFANRTGNSNDQLKIVSFEGDESSTFDDVTINELAIRRVRFGPDGNTICIVGSKGIRILDLDSSNRMDLIGSRDTVESISFHPNGNRLASGCQDGTIKIWDIRTGKQHLSFFAHSKGVKKIQLSPDGNKIASFDGVKLRLWNTATLELIFGLEIKSDLSKPLIHFSRDGKSLFAAGKFEDGKCEVRQIDSDNGILIHSYIRSLKETSTVTIDPSCERAVVYELENEADGERIDAPRLFNLTAEKWITELTSTVPDDESSSGKEANWTVVCVDAAPTKNFFTTLEINGNQDKTRLRIWSSADGSLIKQLRASHAQGLLGIVGGGVFFSRDTLKIAAIASEDDINIIDTASWNHRQGIKADSLESCCAAFDPSGQRLAIGESGKISIWNVNNGDEVSTLTFSNKITGLHWSREADLIAAGFDDGSVMLWDISADLASQGDLKLPRMEGYRKAKSKLEPFHHADLADTAESRKDWFAATFHRALVMKSDPEQALAWDLLHDAYSRCLKDEFRHIEISPVATDMLRLPRGKKLPTQVAKSDRITNRLKEVVLNREFQSENIRPKFDRAIQKLICSAEEGVDAIRTLALLEYRLGLYSDAIKTIGRTVVSSKTHEYPLDIAILALCQRRLGEIEKANVLETRLHEAMAVSSQPSYECLVFYTEFIGEDPQESHLTRSKQSRGIGLPATSWPRRATRRRKSPMGGGVF